MSEHKSALIRPATAGDIPRLMEIRASVRENRLSDPDSISAADYRTFIDQGCCWVALHLEGIGGFAAWDPQEASLWALFVDPQAEGRGIGRALLERVVQDAKNRSIERLTLFTTAGSGAEEFYRRAGWSIADTDHSGDVGMELHLQAEEPVIARPSD